MAQMPCPKLLFNYSSVVRVFMEPDFGARETMGVVGQLMGDSMVYYLSGDAWIFKHAGDGDIGVLGESIQSDRA